MRINRAFTIRAAAVAAALASLAWPHYLDGAGGTAEFALARFLQPTGHRLQAYRALRHLVGSTHDDGMRATMTVWTELLGNGAFRYQIVNEEGSDHTRNRVFRGVLEGEAKAVRTGESGFGDLTTANYLFSPSGAGDDGLARIAVKPRRPHQMRIVGELFVRPEDGELIRVEGQLSKRPSFWTRRIDVIRRYATLAGTRVPISVDATAHVLIVGRYHFSMQWEYESVNGHYVGSPIPRSVRAAAPQGLPE